MSTKNGAVILVSQAPDAENIYIDFVPEIWLT